MKINILNYQIEIADLDGRFSQVLQWLEDDFRDFKKTNISWKTLVIELGEFSQRPRPFWMAKPSVQVFGWGRVKNYLYKNGVQLTVDFSDKRCAQVYGRTECVYETVYLFILSTLGEWLEADGWVRLHGLSLSIDNQVSVMVAPSGFGKSYLAKELLGGEERAVVWGDEILLCRDGEAINFPLRLTQKFDELAPGQRFTYRNGRAHKQVLSSRLRHYPRQKLKKVLLVNSGIFSVLIGSGLPQMLEFRWRFNGLPNLFRTFIYRLKFILFTKEIEKIQVERLSSQGLIDILDS